jgi:hypothetical protein
MCNLLLPIMPIFTVHTCQSELESGMKSLVLISLESQEERISSDFLSHLQPIGNCCRPIIIIYLHLFENGLDVINLDLDSVVSVI